MNKIDFVITWVDGNDKEWLKEKSKYMPNESTDVGQARYRNWDNLKYWFRGVEKFAPWVNKIYFVTYGHVPNWLNLNHPKLVIVKHEDYMDEKYLPTFNSIPIELSLHKIKELSENFVYFNDDMFLINHTKPTDFFKNNLPCDSALLNIIPSAHSDGFTNTLLNNLRIINKHFKMREVIKNNFFKWANLRYGKSFIRTLVLGTWWHFPGFKILHLPVSYKKSTFNKVWSLEYDDLDKASKQKFRNNYTTINHFVIQEWQLVTGKFSPRTTKFGKYFEISSTNEELTNAIEKQKYKCICINDNEEVECSKKIINEINNAFEKILPQKSNFEKRI